MVKPAGKVGRRSLTHTAASTPIPLTEIGSPAEGSYQTEALSYHAVPRPFKRLPSAPGPWTNPSILPPALARRTGGTTKRNAKQILLLERERVSGGNGFNSDHVVKRPAPAGGSTGPGRKKAGWKAVKTGVNTPDDVLDPSRSASPVKPGVVIKDVMTYHTPLAPPSLLPAKHYCDITGLPARYTDPRTKLRYKGLDVWPIIRTLGPGADQAYLAVRGAENILK